MSDLVPPTSAIFNPITGATFTSGFATTRDLFGQTSQQIGNARTTDNSGTSWTGGEWWQQLQPGSWNGVGFILDAANTLAGRRVAIHEYPYRDDAWVEDLGKLPRRFQIQGYLTGDDVYRQRDAMIAACEIAGPGTLVHPTLGSISCVLLEFSTADRRERGRYVEIQFAFILAGDVKYPAATIASGNAISTASAALNAASKGDLGGALKSITGGASPFASASSSLGAIAEIPRAAISSLTSFTSMATGAVNDATRIMGAVRGIQGIFGRFAVGSRSTMLPVTATVQSVLAAATTTRTAVYAAADLVNRTAALL
jgi:prophage DNA circulation protein